MKKSIVLTIGCAAAALVLTGCANVTALSGSPATIGGMGPNIYSQISANTLVPQYQPKQAYRVVKRNVKATATLKSFFAAFNFGDASYAALKAKALKAAPGANDLTDIVFDYSQVCICGVNTVTVTMTATAIKY